LYLKLGFIQYEIKSCEIFPQKCFPVTEKCKQTQSRYILQMIIQLSIKLDFYVMHLFMTYMKRYIHIKIYDRAFGVRYMGEKFPEKMHDISILVCPFLSNFHELPSVL